MEIEDIDNKDKCIARLPWQGVCMGFKLDGSPKGSKADWTHWASIAGVVDVKGNRSSRHMITKREAFLLLVIGKLAQVCFQLNIKKPRTGRPDPTRKRPIPIDEQLDYFALEAIANKWIQHVGEGKIEIAIKALTQNSGEVPGSNVKEVLELLLGKRLSRATIYRKCRGRIKFSTKRSYAQNQVNLMIRSLS